MGYKGAYYTSSYFIRVGLFPMWSPSPHLFIFLNLISLFKTKKKSIIKRIKLIMQLLKLFSIKTCQFQIMILFFYFSSFFFFHYSPYLRSLKFKFSFFYPIICLISMIINISLNLWLFYIYIYLYIIIFWILSNEIIYSRNNNSRKYSNIENIEYCK